MTLDLLIGVVAFAFAAEGLRRIRSGRPLGRVLLGVAAVTAVGGTIALEQPGVVVVPVGALMITEAFGWERAHRWVAFGLLACGFFALLAGGYLLAE